MQLTEGSPQPQPFLGTHHQQCSNSRNQLRFFSTSVAGMTRTYHPATKTFFAERSNPHVPLYLPFVSRNSCCRRNYQTPVATNYQ